MALKEFRFFISVRTPKVSDPASRTDRLTSARMDPYSPLLMEHGLRVMIGKGPRSREVAEAVKKYRGLYLQAYGGCGALYASCVTSSRLIAYPELGPEALLELQVHDFPAVCLIDCLPD